jgi:hypothetical protein
VQILTHGAGRAPACNGCRVYHDLFTGLLIVGAVAVAVPLLLGLVPAVKVPAMVLEILGGSWSDRRSWGGYISTWLSGRPGQTAGA